MENHKPHITSLSSSVSFGTNPHHCSKRAGKVDPSGGFPTFPEVNGLSMRRDLNIIIRIIS